MPEIQNAEPGHRREPLLKIDSETTTSASGLDASLTEGIDLGSLVWSHARWWLPAILVRPLFGSSDWWIDYERASDLTHISWTAEQPASRSVLRALTNVDQALGAIGTASTARSGRQLELARRAAARQHETPSEDALSWARKLAHEMAKLDD